MPNIGIVLREEIVRLSRKESRSQINPTRKAAAQHRRDIAELKRHVAQLERQVALLLRRNLGVAQVVSPTSAAKPVRFAAKGLQANRARLGLSAEDFGKLLGVSAQSIYNWEQEKARPRAEQRAKVAALRAIGKREAEERLAQLNGGGSASKRKR